MSGQPTRFSQAQILIAALFAVVMTGEMPETTFPLKGEIEPLEQEFKDVLIESARHCKYRLATASIKFIDDSPWHYSEKASICTELCRLRLMPSSVAEKVAEALHDRHGFYSTARWLTERPKLRRHRGIAALVAGNFGVNVGFVTKCWEMPEQLDESWRLCRGELWKIRAERAGGLA